jgi:hypothetical protein
MSERDAGLDLANEVFCSDLVEDVPAAFDPGTVNPDPGCIKLQLRTGDMVVV